MKTLFIGGIKSGKSKNAEIYVLKHASKKPYYLATTEFFDSEMHEKIKHHQLQRGEKFQTIEEGLNLLHAVKNIDSIILIKCISMWINNMLYHEKTQEDILTEIQTLMNQTQSLVFVINDVSTSVVSDNPLVREFVNINGLVSQLIASKCDSVYNTVAGISIKIK